MKQSCEYSKSCNFFTNVGEIYCITCQEIFDPTRRASIAKFIEFSDREIDELNDLQRQRLKKMTSIRNGPPK